MPLVAHEDVGTTRRRPLSGRRRLQAWERTGGICVVCDWHIDGVRERWIVEHIRARELGGADDNANMGPAHEACGREKTRDDHARTARAKRQKIRHFGVDVAVHELSGSRACALKRKVNGTVVIRDSPNRSTSAAELRVGQGGTMAFARMSPAVDDVVEPCDGVFLPPPFSDKANAAGTVDTMNSRERSARHAGTGGTDKGFASSGEILPAIPAHLVFVFTDRSLLSGENEQEYDNLLHSIIQQVKPTDVIEAFWVKDVINLIWEAKRLHRIRGQILAQARLKAAEELIVLGLPKADPIGLNRLGGPTVDALAAGWVAGSTEAKGRADKILEDRGFTAADVDAYGFLINLPAIERIDRLRLVADQRRDALLREIGRKRSNFAQQVRSATSDVIDVEPTEAR